MLSIGSFRTRDCQGLTRRAFLQVAGTAPWLWGLTGTRPANSAESSPAISILVVWLGGGPSHLDLFDPKPQASADYRGPFTSIATRTTGLRFSEILPNLAARSDRLSVVRSNINYAGGHRPAGSIGLTGALSRDGGEDAGGKPGQYPPNFGSILSRARPSGKLPGFISVARGPIGDGVGPVFGYGGGVWGRAYDPLMVSCSERGDVDIPELKLLDELTPARLSDRQTVLNLLDRLRRETDSGRLLDWDEVHRQAYQMLAAEGGREAFDLSRESLRTRAAYGQTSFGQSCLLGRRLIEAGVPYVQVNWSQYVEVYYPFSDYGWDTHADNFQLLADWHGPLLDRALSCLLDDLEDRGLLKTTLVLCLGEFGRTPRINSIGSRDHWHQCYFSIWAGGGIQPGRIVGASDAHGEYPVTDPVTPAMVGATALELAGVTSPVRAQLRVLPEGRVIHELL
jgi:hypothetical protein